MSYVIEFLGLAANPLRPVLRARYLKGYDPYGDPPGAAPYRVGKAEWTTKINEALRFGSHEEAVAFWRQVHPGTPVRPDGQPNRPLTAYSITVSPLELAGTGGAAWKN